MPLEFRNTLPGDAAGIADLKKIVWPEETSGRGQILQAILDSRHAGVVAIDDGQIIGFVDGFSTTSLVGQKRWEVDLLAVHPAYRGRGIAGRLVGSSVLAGSLAGAQMVRGLVRSDNTPSQRVFQRCGFMKNTSTLRLFLRLLEEPEADEPSLSLPKFLIPVRTYGYQGLWLEKDYSSSGFEAGRMALAAGCWDSVGALVPLDDDDACRIAESAGFHAISDYCWWERVYDGTDPFSFDF